MHDILLFCKPVIKVNAITGKWSFKAGQPGKMVMDCPIDIALMPVGCHAVGSAVINNKVAPKSLFDDCDWEMLAIRIDGVAGEVKSMSFVAGVILRLGGPEFGNVVVICKDMSHESASKSAVACAIVSWISILGSFWVSNSKKVRSV